MHDKALCRDLSRKVIDRKCRFMYLTNLFFFCFLVFRHVLAAYASFLWDYGDEEEEDQVQVPLFQEGRMTAANV